MDGFFREYVLFIPVFAWMAAILAKAIVLLAQWKFEFPRVFGSGGMPSLHSTLVTSIATAVGIRNGIWSEQFAMVLVFASIVIYDAINVRYEVWLHAQALNKLGKKQGEDFDFNESVGHFPNEALAGSVLGIVVAMVLMNI